MTNDDDRVPILVRDDAPPNHVLAIVKWSLLVVFLTGCFVAVILLLKAVQ